MSGYLPGDDHDGLSRLAPRLIATTDAVIDGEADEDAADVVIVGIVRGHSVKASAPATTTPSWRSGCTASKPSTGPRPTRSARWCCVWPTPAAA